MDESFSQALLLLSYLILSAFFSGSETAFFSLTKIQLKQLENTDSKSSIRIFNLLKRPNQLLILVLLGNTIVNVAASTTAALLAINIGESFMLPRWLILIFEVVLMTFVLLVIGEITPKLLAFSSPVKFAKFSGFFLNILRIILWPVIQILDLVSKLFSHGKDHRSSNMTTEELKHLLHSNSNQTELAKTEKDIITSIFRFSSTLAKEIMIPRVDLITAEISDGIDEIKKKIMESGHSKIPIYKKNIDNIIGFVYAKDILLSKEIKTANSLLRPALFITENTKIQNLLNQFQTKQIQVSIVVDEYGGTSGLITLEDILEELVGEIMDEYDTEKLPITKIHDYKYEINGAVSISELNDKFRLGIDSDKYDNLAEFLYDRFNKVPTKNESINFEGKAIFSVSNIKNQRINFVQMQLIQDDEEITN